VRFYAAGMGGTRSAYSLLHQARMASFEEARLEVVKRMYRRRFGAPMDGHQTVEQLRGMEGVRVREAYAKASRDSGVPWSGRNYDRGNWATADPVNRALSCANSCLYGLCHAAILSAGYSPAIGFIHTGKQLSFVYDIADLYKVEITIPLAFRITGESPTNLERAVRQSLRDSFRASKLMQRVIPDIRAVLAENVSTEDFLGDADPALPESLWTPQAEAGIRSGEFAPDYDPFRELESSPPPHVSMSNFESAKDGQEPAVYDPFADE
jgi:CRISPR-associated protein Cas1